MENSSKKTSFYSHLKSKKIYVKWRPALRWYDLNRKTINIVQTEFIKWVLLHLEINTTLHVSRENVYWHYSKTYVKSIT